MMIVTSKAYILNTPDRFFPNIQVSVNNSFQDYVKWRMLHDHINFIYAISQNVTKSPKNIFTYLILGCLQKLKQDFQDIAF